jgi:hypothetical protein
MRGAQKSHERAKLQRFRWKKSWCLLFLSCAAKKTDGVVPRCQSPKDRGIPCGSDRTLRLTLAQLEGSRWNQPDSADSDRRWYHRTSRTYFMVRSVCIRSKAGGEDQGMSGTHAGFKSSSSRLANALDPG